MKTFLPLTLLFGAVIFLSLGALSLASPSPAYTHFATDIPTYRTVLLLLAGLIGAVFAVSALSNRYRTTWK